MKEEKKKKKAAGKPGDAKKQSTDAIKTSAVAEQSAMLKEGTPDSDKKGDGNGHKTNGVTSAKSENRNETISGQPVKPKTSPPQSVDSPSGPVGAETVDKNSDNKPESMDVDG